MARNLYKKYESQISILDYNYTGVSHYNPWRKGIKLNIIEDSQNPEGNYTTYFHEVGHFLDNIAGTEGAFLSSDLLFKQLLREDADNYILQVINSNNCDQNTAYDIISDELSGNTYGGVSDIFGSLTHCRVQGDWGHDPDYWRFDETKIEKEAFANMFEASIGNSEKKEGMMHFFPQAYARFEYLIRSRIND